VIHNLKSFHGGLLKEFGDRYASTTALICQAPSKSGQHQIEFERNPLEAKYGDINSTNHEEDDGVFFLMRRVRRSNSTRGTTRLGNLADLMVNKQPSSVATTLMCKPTHLDNTHRRLVGRDPLYPPHAMDLRKSIG
jgi:hypothetical protein